jgi:D-amino-acid dehydrogenase
MSDTKSVLIIGGGVIGLLLRLVPARRGARRGRSRSAAPRTTTGCSQGNAGLICPSHIVPLAAPGMITAGLRWLLDCAQPFLHQAAPESRPAALGAALLQAPPPPRT